MEEEKLVELQNLVIMERENFVRFIFNGSWNSVVHRENIDLKLLDYEQTVAVAATEGIDMETKDIIYKWTYIQAVFFTSTILTTIGKSGATEARRTEGVKSFFFFGKLTKIGDKQTKNQIILAEIAPLYNPEPLDT